jgi:glucose uptake protein
MFIVQSYGTAVVFCIITMLCWGSWANTQKLATRTWRFELFYWDYVLGIFLFSLISAFTLGSHGELGRSFMADLSQAGGGSLLSALAGGIIFNAANILFSAAISIAGMAVAFPIGIGIALVLGVLLNYFSLARGNPVYLFSGVALVCMAIVMNALAFKKAGTDSGRISSKGITLSIVAGILMSFFYRFIAGAMDLENFAFPAAGKLTAYTAVVIFSLGILLSNFLFNSILMKRPFSGLPVSYADYFKGRFSTHLTGIFGGLIWGLGNSLNLIAAGKAGPAISYGLGQGATLIAALWGILIWKEFSQAPKGTNILLGSMLIAYLSGLTFIVLAK